MFNLCNTHNSWYRTLFFKCIFILWTVPWGHPHFNAQKHKRVWRRQHCTTGAFKHLFHHHFAPFFLYLFPCSSRHVFAIPFCTFLTYIHDVGNIGSGWQSEGGQHTFVRPTKKKYDEINGLCMIIVSLAFTVITVRFLLVCNIIFFV